VSALFTPFTTLPTRRHQRAVSTLLTLHSYSLVLFPLVDISLPLLTISRSHWNVLALHRQLPPAPPTPTTPTRRRRNLDHHSLNKVACSRLFLSLENCKLACFGASSHLRPLSPLSLDISTLTYLYKSYNLNLNSFPRHPHHHHSLDRQCPSWTIARCATRRGEDRPRSWTSVSRDAQEAAGRVEWSMWKGRRASKRRLRASETRSTGVALPTVLHIICWACVLCVVCSGMRVLSCAKF
jgi:hypothetical protein